MHAPRFLKTIQPCPFCVIVRQVAIMGSYLAVLFALYLVPLGMYSPCIKQEGTLGPAPILIGHRGAPMVKTPAQIIMWCLSDFTENHFRSFLFFILFLSGKKCWNESVTVCRFLQLAPENTQLSFQKAVEAGGEGLETDVTIRWAESVSNFSLCFSDSDIVRTVTLCDRQSSLCLSVSHLLECSVAQLSLYLHFFCLPIPFLFFLHSYPFFFFVLSVSHHRETAKWTQY